jgi:hypothetical protein
MGNLKNEKNDQVVENIVEESFVDYFMGVLKVFKLVC